MHTQTRTASSDQHLNSWLLWSAPPTEERHVLSVAELAECRCPELCDRDHANE
jgi:hypothetical protein